MLSGFRLWFNNASFQLFCKHTETLHHLLLIVSSAHCWGIISAAIQTKDFAWWSSSAFSSLACCCCLDGVKSWMFLAHGFAAFSVSECAGCNRETSNPLLSEWHRGASKLLDLFVYRLYWQQWKITSLEVIWGTAVIWGPYLRGGGWQNSPTEAGRSVVIVDVLPDKQKYSHSMGCNSWTLKAMP